MGIIEKMELPEMECPLSEDLLTIIAVANSHQYISVLENYPESDGLCIHEHLEEMMRRWKDGVYSQCTCIAHAELALEKPDAYKRHLCQLIRTQTPLHNDTGILFSVTLLELLMGALGKSNFVAQRSGLVDSVSYVLMADDSQHMFRGYPDFAIHYESTTMANRILVLMGEIQSTRDPATQNAIYAVGNLAATPLKQLLILIIMKKKMVTTAIAQLKPGPLSSPPDALGVVSLKYFVSPHAIDLTEPKGIADLAYRFYYSSSLCNYVQQLSRLLLQRDSKGSDFHGSIGEGGCMV